MRDVKVIYVSENKYPISIWNLFNAAPAPVEEDEEGDEVVEATGDLSIPSPPPERGTVDSAREVLKRRSPSSSWQDKILLMLEGKSFSDRGDRNDCMFKVVSAVVFATAYTNRLRPQDYAELFGASLAVWAAEPGADKNLQQEKTVVVDMAERALRDFDYKWTKSKTDEANISKALGLSVRFDGKPVDAVNVSATIVQYKNAYYVHNFGRQDTNPLPQGYYGPFIEKEVVPALNKFWENCPPQFDLTYQTEGTAKNPDGVTKQKTTTKLVHEYGSLALDVQGDLSLEKSYFDLKTCVFHEAICPIRVLDPEFDPSFDEYLQIAFGLGYPKFIDYLSYFLRRDLAIGAPYIEGPSGAGKGALVAGLSRFWGRTGPTDYERIAAADFNAFKVPFIVLDEGLTVSRKTSAHIRHLIATGEHTINPKGLPQYVLKGYPLVMFTANNKHVFTQITSNEDLSEDDIDAIARRFIYFRMSDEAPQWLADRNLGRELTNRWVEGDAIAKHVLWLNQNHQKNVIPGKRFVVEGESTEVHRALVTRGEKRGLVLEWLAHFATNPVAVERFYATKKSEQLAKIGNGRLLVNTRAVSENWTIYGEKSPCLTTTMIGRILGQISTRVRLGDPDDRVRYHNINFDHVLDWSSGDAQIGNPRKMKEHFNREIDDDEV